jgi:hypothetical protein
MARNNTGRLNKKPYFRVEDGSSIQVQETRNAFQRSLARNAFSKRCIEPNLYVYRYGISGSPNFPGLQEILASWLGSPVVVSTNK